MTEVRRLEPSEIIIWEGRLWPFVHRACMRSSGRYTAKHILDWAAQGRWQIWLVLEAGAISFVLGTELLEFPTGLRAIAFRFGTGSGRNRWQDRIDDVLAWARTQNCTLAEGVFRKGWARVLPGWNETHTFLERSL